MTWKKVSGKFGIKDIWESDSRYIAVDKSHVRLTGYDVLSIPKNSPRREILTMGHKPTKREADRFAKQWMRQHPKE